MTNAGRDDWNGGKSDTETNSEQIFPHCIKVYAYKNSLRVIRLTLLSSFSVISFFNVVKTLLYLLC